MDGIVIDDCKEQAGYKDELIRPNRVAWQLACLRHGFPIVGVPVHPRGRGGVVSVGCSLLMWF